MRTATLRVLSLAFALGAAASAAGGALADTVTLCGVEGPVTRALADLSRLFETETEHIVQFELASPTDFEAAMLERLSERGRGCDLILGRAEWLGEAVRRNAYVELGELIADGIVDPDEFLPAVTFAHSVWPKDGQRYFALPASGDALGWAYRKDWFQRTELRDAFRAQFRRDLAPPERWSDIRDIAAFFTGREIDGARVSGVALAAAPDPGDPAGGGVAPGALSALYAWGFAHDNPAGSYIVDGVVNTPNAATALAAFRDLLDCCAVPNARYARAAGASRAFRNGQAALELNWFSSFAELVRSPDEAKKFGFFANPGQLRHGSVLGGYGLAVTQAAASPDAALAYLAWFALPEVQRVWAELGGMSAHQAAFEDPAYDRSTPYAAAFLQAIATGRASWQDPAFAELRAALERRLRAYVVDGTGTAQEALDLVAADWTRILENLGRL